MLSWYMLCCLAHLLCTGFCSDELLLLVLRVRFRGGKTLKLGCYFRPTSSWPHSERTTIIFSMFAVMFFFFWKFPWKKTCCSQSWCPRSDKIIFVDANLCLEHRKLCRRHLCGSHSCAARWRTEHQLHWTHETEMITGRSVLYLGARSSAWAAGWAWRRGLPARTSGRRRWRTRRSRRTSPKSCPPSTTSSRATTAASVSLGVLRRDFSTDHCSSSPQCSSFACNTTSVVHCGTCLCASGGRSDDRQNRLPDGAGQRVRLRGGSSVLICSERQSEWKCLRMFSETTTNCGTGCGTDLEWWLAVEWLKERSQKECFRITDPVRFEIDEHPCNKCRLRYRGGVLVGPCDVDERVFVRTGTTTRQKI